ncbi:MAG: XrtA/PEP-CTERM system TPR-repeat protein PrsT [Gammaproteobacteria bacterium]
MNSLQRWSRPLVLGSLLILGTSPLAQAQTALDDARKALESGDLRTAVITVKGYLQQNPDDGAARLMLAKAYLRAGAGAPAEKELRHARSAGIPENQWMVPMARALLLQGRSDDVISQVNPNYGVSDDVKGDVLALHGMAYLVGKDMDKARAAFDKAHKVAPGGLEVALGLARLALLDKDYDTADKFAQQAIARDSKRADGWLVRGEVSRLKGDHGKAALSFDKALNAEPGNLAAMLGRATAYIALGKAKIAEQDIETVLKHQPNHPMALFLQALGQFQGQNLQGAEDSLLQVLRLVPNHAPSNFLAGTVYFQTERLELAVEHLERYLKAVPGQIQATKLLAAAKLKLKEPDDAEALLRRVVAANPEDAQAQALLGTASLMRKDFDAGTEALEKAVELAPELAAMRAQLALGRLASGKVDAAIDDLKAAVDMGSGMVQADVLLVMALVNKKAYDDAMAAVEKMILRNPKDPLAQNLKGAVLQAKEDSTAARAAFQRALDMDPDFVPAALNLASLDLADGKAAEAEKDLNALNQRLPDNIQVMMMLSRIRATEKDEAGAMNWVKKAYDAQPTAVEPASVLIQGHLARGEADQALPIARRLVEANAESVPAGRLFAVSLARNKQWDQSIDEWRRLADLSSESPEPWNEIGAIQIQQGNYREAEDAIDRALRKNDKFLPALLNRMELARRQQDDGAAREVISSVKRNYPKLAVGFELEGGFEERKGDFAKAAEAYAKAFGIQPNALLAVKRFNALKKSGETAKARGLLADWLKQNPEDVKVREILAVAYHEEGDMKQAASQYEEIAKVQPENVVVLNNLAWMFHEQGDKRAEDYARRAYKLADKRPEVVDTLGVILLKVDKPQEAVDLLERAVTLAPKRPDMRFHFAQALAAAGREQDAVLQLKRVVADEAKFAEREQAEKLLKKLETPG